MFSTILKTLQAGNQFWYCMLKRMLKHQNWGAGKEYGDLDKGKSMAEAPYMFLAPRRVISTHGKSGYIKRGLILFSLNQENRKDQRGKWKLKIKIFPQLK
jgi:hypothetical protein